MMWRKSALIVDSNSGVSSRRCLTRRRRCRTATSSFSETFSRRCAYASPETASMPTTTRRVALFIKLPRVTSAARASAEGRVLERHREPEADADLKHHVVDQRGIGVLLGLRCRGVHHHRPVLGLEVIEEHVVADA